MLKDNKLTRQTQQIGLVTFLRLKINKIHKKHHQIPLTMIKV